MGLVVTSAATWTAWHVDRSSEHRLLELQTRQAAAVLGSTIGDIQSPLRTILDVAAATGGSPPQFTRFMAPDIGAHGLFASASLWVRSGDTVAPVASTGGRPALPATSPAAHALLARSFHSATFLVTSVTAAGLQRIGYALADPADGRFAVYAERVIPANRRVPIESSSAFADLNFATYLGSTLNARTLATTDVPADRLPLSGDTARVAIPFGDTTLTLIAVPSRHLGSALAGELPWIFLVVGIVLTIAAVLLAGQLVRRRLRAEGDAQTISGLYDKLDELYSEQRTISETLQHALLPHSLPTMARLSVASRYLSGARGVDVGGDWFSFLELGESRFAFVVGDVSGRGVSAATVMARLRFTLQAYLLEDHSPETALAMCSRQLDIVRDGHMATVLVGVGDTATRRIAVASAGHYSPLVIADDGPRFVPAAVGPPLGVEPTSYAATTFDMSPGSTLLAFTDGLVERRDESIERGLDRLSAAAAADPDQTLDELLSSVLSTMIGSAAEDDTAILALRWTG
ncbi:PP2C family protein-serine/threonine phosphatase [uncultured Jatrophihabitans sp.]|uniref:PP2C family protein-serine/threonine phosphatase n=1 Tax=uncultured Jatrophihabitans sp. TaxID=1610747 RepID=UPI0035CCA39B